uniref:Uncharacterized protein n=1 Tax=Triticum urartu TaxID=4572 RepID=A0A8R7UYM1_TRIUA
MRRGRRSRVRRPRRTSSRRAARPGPQALLGLPRQPRLLLAVRPHRLPKGFQALVGDEVSPEASGGAVVGIRREETGRRPVAVVVEGLVDVLDDDEGLADGAVAVEEDGDRLVNRVVGEQQLALVGQVLHEQLVWHPLERELPNAVMSLTGAGPCAGCCDILKT